MGASRPLFSVIVPVCEGAGVLPHCLDALCASDLPRDRWELIVVDDSSEDRTPEIAAPYADRVLSLPGPPRGPAYARNRGSQIARGEYLGFVDADVCVHPDALSRFAATFVREPEVGAVFGAYDTAPRAPGVVSQYRNLVHHYVHAQGAGDVETFWAGCGAIRREIFLRAGRFDARRYPRPQIEDIELGYRVRELGQRILLAPEIQGTHLKAWTLREMIIGDLWNRGVPWMRLLLEKRRATRPGPLNLRAKEQFCTGLAGTATLTLVVGAMRGDARWLVATVACVLLVLVGNLPLLRWFARVRGPGFAVRVIPLRLLYYLLNCLAAVIGWFQHRVGGDLVRLGPPRSPNPRAAEPMPAAMPSHRDREPVTCE